MLVIIPLFLFFSFSWKLGRPETTGKKLLPCLEVADVEGKSQLSNDAEQGGPGRVVA